MIFHTLCQWIVVMFFGLWTITSFMVIGEQRKAMTLSTAIVRLVVAIVFCFVIIVLL